jgi:hypothetical protein
MADSAEVKKAREALCSVVDADYDINSSWPSFIKALAALEKAVAVQVRSDEPVDRLVKDEPGQERGATDDEKTLPPYCIAVHPDAKSIEQLGPVRVDTVDCACGNSEEAGFCLAVRASNTPCPTCSGLLMGRCNGCGSCMCLHCLLAETVKRREERRVPLINTESDLLS